MTLGTNLKDLADFKNNLVVEGADFVRRIEARCNGSDIFIGAIVTRDEETRPDIDLCGEDEAPLGIVEGYTNRDEPPSDGYWSLDGDTPFADNKWVIVGVLTPGQIIWVCSTANVNINEGEYLKVVDGLVQRGGTGDDLLLKAEEDVTGTASTTKYFRASVVKS